ncbi:MAG: anthranilate phosphoribosyltransferase [Candidatus Magnetobacterium sp. LHC-1]|uniref:Anthranilate phosphoribosyltransferase n=1 Tax=Candidatus Magnetobacterium casense TaxID=1455061 RepID=A0ABS6RX06_9BACT|nr:anthranilate phosphoribosyltransferase [Candidatus Magnetobacterium casensis]MBF0608220.1 anthranilate phosphoribosyltransferase [Nitrospirota bacterium]MBV6341158.1 anthranilate phosphoribosyltransferase [Candidatus Magnetobacterium casensis]
MIREAIGMLVQGLNLSTDEMTECMTEIMEGKATDAQIGSFLTALRLKGESVDEITAAAAVMRLKAVRIKAPENVLDTCGTGGDLAHTFNISTTAAIVLAACGVPIAKHGNRSVSSRSGSADVLEALGIKIDLPADKVERCLFETGFGFLFAPMFHPAMRYAVNPRREIGVRTIFNILGPLTNPAGARRQILGVFSPALTEPLAMVLGNLGAEDAMVCHGQDGLDEITITDGTKITRYRDGKVENMYLCPEDFGFKRGRLEDIAGADKDDNARHTLDVLSGYMGTKRNIVVINAAAGLMVSDLGIGIEAAVDMVQECIESGRAMKKLQEIQKVSNAL